MNSVYYLCFLERQGTEYKLCYKILFAEFNMICEILSSRRKLPTTAWRAGLGNLASFKLPASGAVCDLSSHIFSLFLSADRKYGTTYVVYVSRYLLISDMHARQIGRLSSYATSSFAK